MARKSLNEVKKRVPTAEVVGEIIFENGTKLARAKRILGGQVKREDLPSSLSRFFRKTDFGDADILEVYKQLGGVYIDINGERYNVKK